MKKFALVAFALGLLLALSCQKEDLHPDYPFTIQVQTLDDSIPQQNVQVEVLASSNNGFKLFFKDYTDEQGQVSFEYDANANFTIRAIKGDDPIRFIGCTEVKLQPNENVFKVVYLRPYDQEVQGCDLN